MSEIKNNEVWINGRPFSQWTPKEHQMWQNESISLLNDINRIRGKMAYLAQLKGWINVQ